MQNLSDIPSDQSIPSAQEAKRLEALRRFEILDTLPEQSYEDIAYLASHADCFGFLFMPEHRW